MVKHMLFARHDAIQRIDVLVNATNKRHSEGSLMFKSNKGTRLCTVLREANTLLNYEITKQNTTIPTDILEVTCVTKSASSDNVSSNLNKAGFLDQWEA